MVVFISYKYYAIREATVNIRHYIDCVKRCTLQFAHDNINFVTGQVVWEGLVRSTELA